MTGARDIFENEKAEIPFSEVEGNPVAIIIKPMITIPIPIIIR